ncbi:MAG: bacillithiol biosynthesis deacetylase BshB1 [Planctomycetes bacterium]|nr:bacillithiol biosynthesis deacetylase BshB1 [Planctomycetota bacterium]
MHEKLDVLAVAAHPDDAEICVGGTLLTLARAGKRCGIVDLTRGEMGTRGTRADRDHETSAANAVMRLALRANLELPDGRIEATIDARERLADLIRRHAPDVVLAHHLEDLHPDHAAAGRIAREAWYLSGLARLAELAGDVPARRPKRLYHFMGHVTFEPTFVVDIGPVWEEKLALVRCYASQLAPAHAKDEGRHFLFGADILQRMETRARFYGERIGARFGEPLLARGPLPCFDPLLVRDTGDR